MEHDTHVRSILTQWQTGQITDAQACGAAESLPDGEARAYVLRVIDYTPSDVDPAQLGWEIS